MVLVGRALVLMSPAAGRSGDEARRERLAATIADSLDRRGLTAEFLQATSAKGAAQALVDGVAAGCDLVVVAGGDGSVRLGVGAVAGTGVPLGIVPLGTGNILAAVLGIQRDPLAAARRLSSAEPRTIDSGLLVSGKDREAFAIAAGAGIDARVMEGTGSRTKAKFGVLAYFATIARMLPSLPVSETEIVVDGKTFNLPTVAVLIANCGQIIPGLLGPRSPLDPTDGVLDVVAIRGGSRATALPRAAMAGLDALLRAGPGLTGHSLRLQAKEVRVTTNPPEPVQVDGDVLPGIGASFKAEIREKSLIVLV